MNSISIRRASTEISDIRSILDGSRIFYMIAALIQSAFQTGCLSVESEGLIRQILATGSCKSADLDALRLLYDAVQLGKIRREAHQSVQMPCIATSAKLERRLTA